MSARQTLDVAHLPDFAFGDRSPLRWGMLGMIAIEGAAFALLAVAYIYLRTRVPNWPPAAAPPALLWGTLNLVLMLLAAVPNEITKRAANRMDGRRAMWWLAVCIVWALGLCAIRALEFTALNVWWDTNAYGSIVWTLLGYHTAHLITDVADSIVLFWFAGRRPLDGRRLVDISENAVYWYFVIAAWIPVYLLLYVAPRLV
jgi:heme/copper-type cytochrome/quinol oxidase subunit 3